MDSISDTETANDSDSDSTWLPTVYIRRTCAQARRVQPPRKAKNASYIMTQLQRNCARLQTQGRLWDVNNLIEEHLLGERQIIAHQARSLLLEMEKYQKEYAALGGIYKKIFFSNCTHLKNILAHQYMMVLSEVNENINRPFNATAENAGSQFSSDNNQYCPILQPVLTHDLDKVSSSITIPSVNNHFYHHDFYESSSENKENYQNSTERFGDNENIVVPEDQLVNKLYEAVPKTFLREEQNLQSSVIFENRSPRPVDIGLTQYQQKRLYNEKNKLESLNKGKNDVKTQYQLKRPYNKKNKLENLNKGQNDLKTKSNLKTTLYHPMGTSILTKCSTVQNEVNIPDRSNEKQENSDNCVLNKAPTNVEQPNLYLKQIVQIENHKNELQASSSEQNCIINNILQVAAEGEGRTSLDPFNPQLTTVNTYSLPTSKTNCKMNYVIPTNLTYAVESSILLPSCEDFREISLDTMINESEKVKIESYKDRNRSFDSLIATALQYLKEEHAPFEDDNDLITQIAEEGLRSDIHNLKEENSINEYHLTDKHLVRIAAKMDVSYEDLQRTVDDVVQIESDESSDGSLSVISASQSPPGNCYSERQIQSGAQHYYW